jgi:hypothetical protein
MNVHLKKLSACVIHQIPAKSTTKAEFIAKARCQVTDLKLHGPSHTFFHLHHCKHHSAVLLLASSYADNYTVFPYLLIVVLVSISEHKGV